MKRLTIGLFLLLAVSLGIGAAAKNAPTYMTPEKREIAQENIANYKWAREESSTWKSRADRVYSNFSSPEETLWSRITSQEIPRAASVTLPQDPAFGSCPYCETNLLSDYGMYPWICDGVNYQWKLQCPDCRRRFPSNNFSSFYQAGLNEHGTFDYALALQNGSHLLTNDLYPEKGDIWGVDDGYGWRPGTSFVANGKTLESRYAFIAYYNHWEIWHPNGHVQSALSALATAYVLTEDPKYGRLGAILLDRIADVYPDMFTGKYAPDFYNVDGGTPSGRALGSVLECTLSYNLAKYYDYLYWIFDDPFVLNFLAKKAAQYNLGDSRADGGVENEKNMSDLVRQNIENGILREVLNGVSSENIKGNLGMHQASAAMAAVVLDSHSETADVLDQILQSSDLQEVLYQPSEGCPRYNSLTISALDKLFDVLPSFYENPKVIERLKVNFPLTLASRKTAPIGDSGSMLGKEFQTPTEMLIRAFTETGDPEIAQFLYLANGNSTDGLNAGIFTHTDNWINYINAIVKEHGESLLSKSSAVTGTQGFFALRDGYLAEDNTLRDFWMHFGATTGHGHADALNLGIDAFGIDLAPDLGEPETIASTPRSNWTRSTIAHNTVQVNDKPQERISGGTALHFDGENDGFVQVMDARAADAYDEADEYRRTVVMMDYEDVSYGIDFFHVIGGDSHTYSFHAMSDTVFETENLNLIAQETGTYAGDSIAFGYLEQSGYDALYDVKRAEQPTDEFSVDFNICDWNRTLDASQNVHLRMTMLNDFASEVALAKGQPPQINDNPEALQFVLARREGSDLNSLFTTVFEPYDTTRYIVSQEQVAIVPIGGDATSANDTAKAVKITLTNGRVDYVVYATNNETLYRVDDRFEFQGFVGVLSFDGDTVIQSYLHDGSILGETNTVPAYSGTVTDFTRELVFENVLLFTPDQADLNLDALIGRYAFVGDNVYPIEGVWFEDGSVLLKVGDVSFINGCQNFVFDYAIEVGQSIRIPLTECDSDAPIWEKIDAQAVIAGNTLSVPLSAVTPSGAEVTYELASKLRGAKIVGNTFYFNPDLAQLGENHVGIIAKNGSLESTIHFSVTVYLPSSGNDIGDIDLDGDIDVSDAVLLFQHSMLPDTYPIEYIGNLDFNRDGVVDVYDAVLLFQHSMLPDLYPIS